ncbi:MAG: secretin N-terminal domain-containing protein [Planctomycetota bacterium]|jgi:type IV pilus assembly protein PilQ
MRKTKKSFYFKSLFFIVMALALTATSATAEELGSASEKIILQSGREWLKTPITYQCTEKAIDQVLMDLADQADVDIVKSPKVIGNVTVKVTNVPLEEVLTNILEAHDYTYIATDNMIRVIARPETSLIREKPITRVYQINYADANDVAGALRKFVSANGRVAFNKGTGHIIVTDMEDRIKGLDNFIAQIDQITPQVLVEVRVYDITSKEGFELDQEWTVARNAPLEGDYIPETETIAREVSPSSTTFTEERIDDISENSFTQGNYRDADDGFGSFTTTTSGTTQRNETSESFNSGWSEVETLTREPRRIENLSQKPFVGGHFDRQTGGSVRFSVLNDAVAINFVLSMLHQTVEAKLLANPRVLVLDNETATFEVVREIPYREMMQVERAAAVTFTEFKNVGVNLKVTPHVARDGMVRLNIHPEFGMLVGYNENGAPIVDARRSRTVTIINDGQTIAMSGLRQQTKSKDVSKVPIFGDLPLIGGLFYSETESEQVQDLVIFITTKIITRAGLTELERAQYQATDLGPVGMSEMRLDSPYFSKQREEKDIKSELDELLRTLEEEY